MTFDTSLENIINKPNKRSPRIKFQSSQHYYNKKFTIYQNNLLKIIYYFLHLFCSFGSIYFTKLFFVAFHKRKKGPKSNKW